MQLEIPKSYYFDIPNVMSIKYLKSDVKNFEVCDGKLKLDLEISYDYLTKGDSEIKTEVKEKNVSMLIDDKYQVKSSDINKLNFELIVNKGVEILFEIELKFVEVQIEVEEEIEKPIIEKLELNDETENKKDEIEKDTDEILEKLLVTRDDTFLEDEITDTEELEGDLINLKDNYSVIKIINIENELDIERIAAENKLTVAEIYEQNSYKIKDRIRVKIDE